MALELAVRAADPSAVKTPLLALLLPAGNALPTGLKKLDAAMNGVLSRALKRGDFRGGRDETLHMQGTEGGAERVLLVGLGKPNSLALGLRRAQDVSRTRRARDRSPSGLLASINPVSKRSALASISGRGSTWTFGRRCRLTSVALR
jgi:leucyl aminopeptidase